MSLPVRDVDSTTWVCHHVMRWYQGPLKREDICRAPARSAYLVGEDHAQPCCGIHDCDASARAMYSFDELLVMDVLRS